MVGIIRIDNTNKSTFNGTHLRYELCANEGAFGEHGEQNSIMGQSQKKNIALLNETHRIHSDSV